MKKIALILIAALIAMTAAFAEPIDETLTCAGNVLEINDDAILIQDSDLDEILVISNEETVFDIDHEIAIGDYLMIDIAELAMDTEIQQVTAAVIRMHVLEGSMIEYSAEDNTILLDTESHGEVLVNLPEAWAETEIDFEYMHVYFDGAMTMSLPAQVSAAFIIPGYAVQGEVTQINEDSLILGGGTENYADEIEVHFEVGTLAEGINVGDVIRVIYNGQMTRSIPPQITAMDMIQVSR